jgi:hypothetical protein
MKKLRLSLLAGVALAASVIAVRSLRDPVTFSRDIAPIVIARCAPCHHAGGAAPFPLLSYADAKARASQIADVTQRRLMPPWMPEPGCVEFAGDRSLSADEIARIRRWVDRGAPEGEAFHAPAPSWKEGWPLGTPDLVVTLPEPYPLAPDGGDVYRNFVLPLPVSSRRHVRAVEFQPGNAKVVHHAFMFIDPTRESLRLDLKDPEPGFPGLHVPSTAQSPSGHFLSWQPGKLGIPEPEDMAWPLEPDSFLVLQVHLRPSGKPELLRPSVGFYFTDKVPTRSPVKLGLWSYEIDLTAGDAACVVKDSYTLPIDLDLLRILPHAHYLCRRMEVVARLPDGSTRCLLRITSWDFNWQGDYAYKEPLFLPKGTVVSMEYSYDNSEGNPRNPNRPPRRVTYGLQSGDEMAELWLQALPRRPGDVKLLDQENQQKVFKAAIAYNRYLLGLNPDDARAHAELGKVHLFLRQPAEARQHLSADLRLRADDDEPHYFLGLLHRTQGRPEEAKAEFQSAIRINPEHPKAHGNLGLVLMEQGQLDAAAREFETALRLNPADDLARSSLEEIAAAKRARKKG